MCLDDVLKLSETSDVRVRVKTDALRDAFMEESDCLILVGGAITTPARYSRFEESLAHLCEDGSIKRYRLTIGKFSDIEVVPEPPEEG